MFRKDSSWTSESIDSGESYKKILHELDVLNLNKVLKSSTKNFKYNPPRDGKKQTSVEAEDTIKVIRSDYETFQKREIEESVLNRIKDNDPWFHY